MKTTTSHNKAGFIMVEYIISLLFVSIFLSLTYVLSKNVNSVKVNISNGVNITENIKIIDSIVYKIRKSEKVNVYANSIENDDFKIKNINNELFVYSNNMMQKDYLFKANDIRFIIMQNEADAIWDVTCSHDSKWIAYSRTAPNNMNIVYVYNLETKKEYPVTEKWYNSSSPSFSSDGRYLIFSSDRDLSPNYSYIEWNYSYGDMSGVYMTLLSMTIIVIRSNS